ncbi:MAG: hypothetical protein WCT05_11790, partial [Lentisphaeria bacterium]
MVRAFIKKRKSKIRSGRKSLFLRFSASGIVVLLAGFVFYLFQPTEIKEEIRFLSHNYLLAKRAIHLDEFAWDLWNLYFSQNFVTSDYEVSDESFVYGGLPRENRGRNRRFLQVLRNRGYWVGYDERLRNPAWVAYRLFEVQGTAEISPRPDSFFPDERTLIQVQSEDYT